MQLSPATVSDSIARLASVEPCRQRANVVVTPLGRVGSDRTGRGDFLEHPFDAVRHRVARRSALTAITGRTIPNRVHVEAAVSVWLVYDVTTARLDLPPALAGLPPTALARRSMRAARGTSVVQTRRRLLMTAVLGVPHHDGLATHRCAHRRPRRWRRSTELERDRKERKRCEHRRVREPRDTTEPSSPGRHDRILRGSVEDLETRRRLG